MTNKVILLDIGNSNTGIATLDLGELIKIQKYPTESLLNHLQKNPPQTAIIASVVPNLNDSLRSIIPHTKFLNHKTVPQIILEVNHPEQVGADRLAASLAAWSEHKTDCLIIDSGTAITCDLITKEGIYKGGNIFPGMGIASKSLNDYTAQIPHITVKKQDKLYGKSTQEAVETGLYHGYIHLINGMIKSYKTQYPSITIIGTGTGLEILLPDLSLDHHDPNLTLKGLQLIAEGLKIQPA